MKQFSHKQITWSAVAVILFGLAISLVLAYATNFRDPITVSFKRLYPAVIVGSRIISINDLEQGEIIAARFGVNKSDARTMIITDSKADVLAHKLNITIPRDAAADESRFYIKGNEVEYKNLLKRDFNNSESLFYKYVIRPQLTDTYLRMKYYADITATDPEYRRAREVLDRISKGEKFEDLAETESADDMTGQLGGDLGFYEAGQLLPELEGQISVSAIGQVRQDVIISRLGYHIIYPVEFSTSEGKKMWHVKHILFVPQGYDKWFQDQTSAIGQKVLKTI